MSEHSVIFEVRNKVGWIFLNRPRVLNSLNSKMVGLILSKLQEWRNDSSIVMVGIQGSGEKGLCAGGDMKSFYGLHEQEAVKMAQDFFLTEYRMDYALHYYPKPVLVFMDGVVMGGGVGISIGGTHRIVTEKTKWAMPEMNIGFFPDVGASYFLNKMPGLLGRYLALTSEVISGADALYAGVADFFVEGENWTELESDLLKMDWSEGHVASQLNEVISQYCSSKEDTLSPIAMEQEKIDRHFSFHTVEEILLSLEEADDEWARETRSTLLKKSPVSLKVTLLQLQKGEHLSLADSFKMEYILGLNFMKNPDFYEGVRSVLVDKDRSPCWNKSTLQEISEEEVLAYFKWNEAWGEEEAIVRALKSEEPI